MRVAVVMPAYNEAEGIGEFLTELNNSLQDWDSEFFVVNDLSTDKTIQALENAGESGIPVNVFTNDINLGHGPSTLRALTLGLDSGSDLIIAIDGDGQFIGSDVAQLVALMKDSDTEIIEGVRRQRNDPAYRSIVSSITRNLVWTRAGVKPTDANTPLRIYRRSALSTILESLPSNAMTPNLLISAITRRRGLTFAEVDVQSIPRRGTEVGGSTWKAKTDFLPSKRFIKFCTGATAQWFTSSIKS